MLLYVFAVLFAVWILLPLWFTFSSSISSGSDLAVGEIGWFPASPTFENFRSILLGTETTVTGGAGTVGTGLRIPKGLGMSALISMALVVTNLVVGAFAGYGLSKYKFTGSGTIFGFVLVSRIIPALVLVVPFFVAFRTVGIINTPWALLVSYHVFTLPLAILLLKNYFDALPPELEEATLVDGGTRFQAFRLIAVPLARPGIIAAGLLVFLEAWGEFFFSLVFTDQLTLPPLLAGLQSLQQFSWTTLAAGLIVALIPPVGVALLFQRYIVSGLAEGAVK
ncbi:MAG: carbohydrate ABC transporter permease [Maioricimonas sp. JB049]